MSSKRLRILAGPNGSGKTSVYEDLSQYEHPDFGVFVNADKIEAELRRRGVFSFHDYGIRADVSRFSAGYERFLEDKGSSVSLSDISITDNFLVLSKRERIDSYFACYLASFIRDEMLAAGVKKMTIETVMSHPSKLDLMKNARELGYRVYLYFVSTESPEINVKRVESRQALGGHGVSTDKIVSRYTRSLQNLYDAMILSNRSFLFDNSGKKPVLVAEYDAASELLRVVGSSSPKWLQEFVIDKIR